MLSNTFYYLAETNQDRSEKSNNKINKSKIDSKINDENYDSPFDLDKWKRYFFASKDLDAEFLVALV